MNRRAGAVLAMAAALVLPPAALATDKGKPSVDTDFLEFLGSIDDEGDGWSEFLESKDPSQAAPPPVPPVAAKPPASAAPPAKSPDQGKGK